MMSVISCDYVMRADKSHMMMISCTCKLAHFHDLDN